MKKIVSLLLVLALCLCSFAALGEEVTSVTWDDVVAQFGEIPGEFVQIEEVGVQMFIISGFNAVEVSEEDAEEGYIALFEADDENSKIAVLYYDVEGMTLEEYAEELSENESVSEIEFGIVNDLPCLTYTAVIDDTTIAVVSFATEAGCMLEIYFAPLNEDTQMLPGIIAASVMTIEE